MLKKCAAFWSGVVCVALLSPHWSAVAQSPAAEQGLALTAIGFADTMVRGSRNLLPLPEVRPAGAPNTVLANNFVQEDGSVSWREVHLFDERSRPIASMNVRTAWDLEAVPRWSSVQVSDFLRFGYYGDGVIYTVDQITFRDRNALPSVEQVYTDILRAYDYPDEVARTVSIVTLADSGPTNEGLIATLLTRDPQDRQQIRICAFTSADRELRVELPAESECGEIMDHDWWSADTPRTFLERVTASYPTARFASVISQDQMGDWNGVGFRVEASDAEAGSPTLYAMHLDRQNESLAVRTTTPEEAVGYSRNTAEDLTTFIYPRPCCSDDQEPGEYRMVFRHAEDGCAVAWLEDLPQFPVYQECAFPLDSLLTTLEMDHITEKLHAKAPRRVESRMAYETN